MDFRQALISAAAAAAMLASAGSAGAQKGDTSEIFDTTTLTFSAAVLKNAPVSVQQLNIEMRKLAEQVPANLRGDYFANMFQLNTITPPALIPYEGLAERHRQLLLQAYYGLVPKDQLVANGTEVEAYLGVRPDPRKIGESQQPAIDDLNAVVKLWSDNGFVVKWLPEVGPTGPYNGQITIGSQPCYQITTLNGQQVATLKCEVAVAFDTPARTAARLWLMRLSFVKSQEMRALTWTVLPGMGNLQINHPKTGEALSGVALTCIAGNTFASNPKTMDGVADVHPGKLLFQMSAKLLVTADTCFPTVIPAFKDPANTNFRIEGNWRPLWLRSPGNPDYKGPLPPQ